MRSDENWKVLKWWLDETDLKIFQCKQNLLHPPPPSIMLYQPSLSQQIEVNMIALQIWCKSWTVIYDVSYQPVISMKTDFISPKKKRSSNLSLNWWVDYLPMIRLITCIYLYDPQINFVFVLKKKITKNHKKYTKSWCSIKK